MQSVGWAVTCRQGRRQENRLRFCCMSVADFTDHKGRRPRGREGAREDPKAEPLGSGTRDKEWSRKRGRPLRSQAWSAGADGRRWRPCMTTHGRRATTRPAAVPPVATSRVPGPESPLFVHGPSERGYGCCPDRDPAKNPHTSVMCHPPGLHLCFSPVANKRQ